MLVLQVVIGIAWVVAAGSDKKQGYCNAGEKSQFSCFKKFEIIYDKFHRCFVA